MDPGHNPILLKNRILGIRDAEEDIRPVCYGLRPVESLAIDPEAFADIGDKQISVFPSDK
jgi:hypothetical protein